MSWHKVLLENIIGVVTKGTTPTTYGMPFTDEGINFVKAEALNGDVSLERSGFAFISEDTHEKLKRSQLAKDDVLVTIAGANVGKCGFVREEDLPANTNQAVGIVRVDPEKASPRFVYYHFKNPSTFTLCQSFGGQAAQPNINLTVLKGMKLKLPNICTQEKIVELLSSYDELIKNNRRRIQLLEESARLLYQEWFVHLRFPGHEHVRIVDGVPEDWLPKVIDDVSEYINRGISPNYDDDGEYLVINQKCVRNRLLKLDLARRQSKEYKIEKAVQLGDVLINSTGTGTLGRVAQVWSNLEKVTVDSHVTIVRPNKDIPYFWLGYTLMSLEKRLEDMGEGATNQKELNRARIREIEVKLPPKLIMEEFHNFTSSVANQILILIQQNNKLIEARDLLLPRLMNGTISV